MDEHIIRIENLWEHWKMTIDLKELARSAGMKVERPKYSEKVVSVPLPRAKKLLKLIRDNGTEKDFEACDKYLATNRRLFKYWIEMR